MSPIPLWPGKITLENRSVSKIAGLRATNLHVKDARSSQLDVAGRATASWRNVLVFFRFASAT
jgi:hypothetical protein